MSETTFDYINCLTSVEKKRVLRELELYSGKRSLPFIRIFNNYDKADQKNEVRLSQSKSTTTLKTTLQDKIGKSLVSYHLANDYYRQWSFQRRALVLLEQGLNKRALEYVEEGLKYCEQGGKTISQLNLHFLKCKILEKLNQSSEEQKEILSNELKIIQKRLKIHFLQPELNDFSKGLSAQDALNQFRGLYFDGIESDFLLKSFYQCSIALCYAALNKNEQAIREIDFIDINAIPDEDFGNLIGSIGMVYSKACRMALSLKEFDFFEKKYSEFKTFINDKPALFYCESKLDRLRLEIDYSQFISVLLLKGHISIAHQMVKDLLLNKHDYSLILKNNQLHEVLLVLANVCLKADDLKHALKFINLFLSKKEASPLVFEAEVISLCIHSKLKHWEYLEYTTPAIFKKFNIKPKSPLRKVLNKLKSEKGKISLSRNEKKELDVFTYLQSDDLLKWANKEV